MTDIAYHPTRLRALRDTFRALRAAEFPWTADTVYLNNASIGPIPERTRRALDEFTAKRTAPHLLPDRELPAEFLDPLRSDDRLVIAELHDGVFQSGMDGDGCVLRSPAREGSG